MKSFSELVEKMSPESKARSIEKYGELKEQLKEEHLGTTLDSFLEEQGILEEVEANAAAKSILKALKEAQEYAKNPNLPGYRIHIRDQNK